MSGEAEGLRPARRDDDEAGLAVGFLGALLGMACLLVLLPKDAVAQSSEPYDIIAMVNQIRAGQGLPAYEIDPILMAVAQSHNDWRAANGLNTHVGPMVRDRSTASRLRVMGIAARCSSRRISSAAWE